MHSVIYSMMYMSVCACMFTGSQYMLTEVKCSKAIEVQVI